MYGQHSLTVTIRIWFLCEGEGVIEPQNYGEALLMSMVTMRGPEQGQD